MTRFHILVTRNSVILQKLHSCPYYAELPDELLVHILFLCLFQSCKEYYVYIGRAKNYTSIATPDH